MSAEASYLDSSALVKLIVAEPESAALRDDVRRRRTTVVSCALARVEVPRAVLAQGNEAVRRASSLLGRIDLVAVDDALLDVAASLPPAVLRSLDAVHVAAAQALGESLDSVVCYDRRMARAARAAGLPVSAPGAESTST
jgi:predicted nucleic acid-binding protein